MTEMLRHSGDQAQQQQFDIDTGTSCRKYISAVSGSGGRMLHATNETDGAVGMQIQNLRVFAGLSQEAASDKLNVGPEELAAYEAGQQRPQPGLVLSLAAAYGVPPSRVFDILAASLHA